MTSTPREETKRRKQTGFAAADSKSPSIVTGKINMTSTPREKTKRRKQTDSDAADSKSPEFHGKRILLIFDESNFPLLENESEFYLKFSHDLNLAQFAQAAMSQGAKVYVTTGNEFVKKNQMWEFSQFHPVVLRAPQPVELDTGIDVVASSGPELLLVKEIFPSARIVAFFAAVHFIESPGLHDRTWLYKIAISLRLHVDLVVTQHERMAQIIRLLGMLTASVDLDGRILSCPLGLWTTTMPSSTLRLQEKKKLGLEGKILIGNAGGIWRWTDYKTFLSAYIKAVRSECKNLKLFITGITQPNNADHAQHSEEVRRMLSDNSDLVSHRPDSAAPIILIDDWAAGGQALRKLLPVLDIGLNLNITNTEGWQAYRVRLLEYISHNIPVLNTKGDWLISQHHESGFLQVTSGDLSGYFDILTALDSGEIDIDALRAKQSRLAEFLHYKRRYTSLLQEILSSPARSDKDPKSLTPCLYDIAEFEGKRELKTQITGALDNLTHKFLTSI